jgi:ribosomal protein S18 acetylase RimI-like enzyme
VAPWVQAGSDQAAALRERFLFNVAAACRKGGLLRPFLPIQELAAIFRMLPFSQPPELDAYLESLGWSMFERTLVLRADVPTASQVSVARDWVEIIDVPRWEEAAAGLLDLAGAVLSAAIERAKSYPLPHIGAVIRHQGEVVACGLAKLEGAHAGLFAVNTAPSHRRQGRGRAIVAALLAEVSRQGSRVAYLQVTADNEVALALYRPFGFAPVYDYWYRGRASER